MQDSVSALPAFGENAAQTLRSRVQVLPLERPPSAKDSPNLANTSKVLPCPCLSYEMHDLALIRMCHISCTSQNSSRSQ